ncbi:MAG: aminotransferase class V-fold PLP-dependent enzyme [Steroidobacteraceae bacterium]
MTFAYLDHAATTPPDPRVVDEMARVLAAGGANPAAVHGPGRAAAARIEVARADVAALVGATPDSVVFTSGATEANNLAILGHAQAWAARHGRRGHLVSLATEHKSVLAPLQRLKAEGWALTLLRPGVDGVLTVETLAAALTVDTALVSLLWVNNETGVAQDVAALSAVVRARGIAVHVDAAQAAGKLALSVAGIDYLVLTGHKFGGPQGIGALVVAPGRRNDLAPQIVGGGQERGLRSGTPAEHQIAGFAAACRLASAERETRAARISSLRERLWAGLRDLPDAQLNGHPSQRVAGILNVTFDGVEGESLAAGVAELAVSPGSACDSASGEPSFVLRAMGRDREAAQSSLRFSLGTTSTEADVDLAVVAVSREHARLWTLSPARPAPTSDWLAAGAHVVSGEAGARRLGAWVRWHWRIDEGRIADVRFQAYGCPATIAAMQHVAERLRDRNFGDDLPGKPADWLAAVNAPVEKLGRMLIIEDAARAALAGKS